MLKKILLKLVDRKAQKHLKNSVKLYLENTKRYISLTKDELRQLPEDELLDAVLARVDNKAEKLEAEHDSTSAAIGLLSKEERSVYCTNYLDCEVNNGGLCQFFANSSKVAAPFIADSLATIGALEHKELFETFVNKYGIDTNDLSSFKSDDVEAFLAQYKRFPFDEYDNAFYDMKPLRDYLVGFVKENIDAF